MNVPVLSTGNVMSLHNIRLCSTYHCCDFHYVNNITCTIILHNTASYQGVYKQWTGLLEWWNTFSFLFLMFIML